MTLLYDFRWPRFSPTHKCSSFRVDIVLVEKVVPFPIVLDEIHVLRAVLIGGWRLLWNLENNMAVSIIQNTLKIITSSVKQWKENFTKMNKLKCTITFEISQLNSFPANCSREFSQLLGITFGTYQKLGLRSGICNKKYDKNN